MLQDHPHVRGDNCTPGNARCTTVGSPPRAWGQPRPRHASRFDQQDHPHVRGDNVACRVACCGHPGSPPRAWGQPAGVNIYSAGARITPTCVGTTSRRPGRNRSGKDHPHVRGDNILARKGDRCIAGSPPRAWGQPAVRVVCVIDHRITPTCVGTTGCKLSAFGRVRITPTCVGTTNPKWKAPGVDEDHPHVRGDNCRAAAGSN